LYAPGGNRWTLTERGRHSLDRSETAIAIGPSSVEWDGDTLTVRIDEVTVPLPSRVRGLVRVRPTALVDRTFALDAAGTHRWRPIAPCARVEVELERPALRWSGTAYLDSNSGDAPLEDAFVRWDWSRAGDDRSATVLYDVARRSGDELSLALRFGADATMQAIEPPPPMRLPHTLWRVPRGTRADEARHATVLRTLEDTPFYARSVLSTRVHGATMHAVHESLSLDRFRSRWVQALLPFRMPRIA
jgi:carotenoid 1,2-hydratase